MSDFKERMFAKMKESGITSSQVLDKLTDMFCESLEHMTTEELREDLEAKGVDVDALLERTEKLLNKYGISMKGKENETPTDDSI